MTRLSRASLLAFLLVLGACTTPSNDPTGYGARTADNFMRGCLAGMGVEVPPANPQSTATTIPEGANSSAVDYCRCVYGGIVENVPFDEFDELDDALSRSLPEAGSTSTTTAEPSVTTTTLIPSEVSEIVAGCKGPA